ncbi:MAG: ACT domain-containing protein [Clostridiales bacterium]|nr:ACT domain-containing protein [Clostridiales bacterium]MBQ2816971.1 ACT domain-containing protein [Clostridia bacterium]MBQ4637367.1 ACT domain-containing protein [Clostridia bacterium]
MFVKQISVFIENRKGRLADFTKVLGDAGVDLVALSVADTTDFGILRAIVTDTEKGVKVLRDAGYTVNITDVLAVAVPDVPGGLAKVVGVLSEKNISIEYLYSFVRNVNGCAIIIFRVDQPVQTADMLRENGITILNQEEIH